MSIGKKDTNEPELNMSQANEMLSQILEQCDIEPNTISLADLISYGNYRKEKYIYQRIGIIIILVLFFLLPLLFISPTFTLTQGGDDYNTYTVTVDSILPVSYISASIDGNYVPVYQADDDVYTIQPTLNGEMNVTVGGKNGQTVTHQITVNTVDTTAPVIADYSTDGDYLELTLTDDKSGVDFDNVYMEYADGSRVKPVSYDAESGLASFTYPTESVNIIVPDLQGNTMHLLVNVK